MSDCQSIDALVTPLVDGELPAAERERVEHHLRLCASCQSRVEAERAVRTLMHGRQSALRSACAPVALRVKCAGHCGLTGRPAGIGRWRRMMPLAAAAVVILGVGGVLLYQLWSPSAGVMAAELAADHVQCFTRPGPQQSAEAVEASLAALFNWHVTLAAHDDGADLDLIGVRQCDYSGGHVAHLMFLHHNEPMSLFMLPRAVYRRDLIETRGQRCAIWSAGDRTFVLVSNAARDEVERVAARVQPAFH